MKKLFLIFIFVYQNTLSKVWHIFGFSCAFYPTCSVYAKEAITEYGFFKGVFMIILRILRCHPWQKDHFDPVTRE